MTRNDRELELELRRDRQRQELVRRAEEKRRQLCNECVRKWDENRKAK